MSKPIKILESVSQVHNLLGLEKPKHPLISVFNHADPNLNLALSNNSFVMDLYMVGLKDGEVGSFSYGRNSYDYDSGTMLFVSPNQVFSPQQSEISKDSKGWTLLFHPDLIQKSKLGETIDNFSYFNYDSHEALHISDDEKEEISRLAAKIKQEYSQNIDKHTQTLIIVNLESILQYCKRFYDRQFYIRENSNKDFIIKFEKFLKKYFSSESLSENGLLTVKQCGDALNMSGHYLSDLLKTETGKSAKEHIDLFLVEKAKKILLKSPLIISEVAYNLGFEYPNHFSKIFKNKTGMSPSEFRNLN